MTTRRTYVLDTSVLLSDPGALLRFDEHDVVVPLVVIGELEDKRDHPDLGWFARQTLRMLDDLRVQHGRLDAPLPVNDVGGTLHAFDPASGKPLWEAPARGLPAAPADTGVPEVLLVPEDAGFMHRDPTSGDRLGTSSASDVPVGGTASAVGTVVVYRLPDRVLAYR